LQILHAAAVGLAAHAVCRYHSTQILCLVAQYTLRVLLAALLT
jgi:hypothetical protein